MKQFAAVAALLALMVAAVPFAAQSRKRPSPPPNLRWGQGPGFRAAEQPAECGHP